MFKKPIVACAILLAFIVAVLSVKLLVPVRQDLAPTMKVECVSKDMGLRKWIPYSHAEIEIYRTWNSQKLIYPVEWQEIKAGPFDHIVAEAQYREAGYTYHIEDLTSRQVDTPSLPLKPGNFVLKGWGGYEDKMGNPIIVQLLYVVKFTVPDCTGK